MENVELLIMVIIFLIVTLLFLLADYILFHYFIKPTQKPIKNLKLISEIIFLFIMAHVLIKVYEKIIMETVEPFTMLLFLVEVILLFLLADHLLFHYLIKPTQKPIKNLKLISEIIFLFIMALALINISALMGPLFFKTIGYDILPDNEITAIDATSCFASSLFTAAFGWLAITLSRNQTTTTEVQLTKDTNGDSIVRVKPKNEDEAKT